MRTDDIPDTVCQKHECRGGYALRVSAHVAGGELEGQDEGGYEGADLYHPSSFINIGILSTFVGEGREEKMDGEWDWSSRYNTQTTRHIPSPGVTSIKDIRR